MRSVVIFDTRFGNTEKVARALATGLAKTGVEALAVNVRDFDSSSLGGYDLICVGAPTEAFSASKPMKDFLSIAKLADLSDKHGFAFDTKIQSRLSGSAAKFIEKHLESWNLRIIAPRESAIVSTTSGAGGVRGARLADGEEGRFEEIGASIGRTLVKTGEQILR